MDKARLLKSFRSITMEHPPLQSLLLLAIIGLDEYVDEESIDQVSLTYTIDKKYRYFLSKSMFKIDRILRDYVKNLNSTADFCKLTGYTLPTIFMKLKKPSQVDALDVEHSGFRALLMYLNCAKPVSSVLYRAARDTDLSKADVVEYVDVLIEHLRTSKEVTQKQEFNNLRVIFMSLAIVYFISLIKYNNIPYATQEGYENCNWDVSLLWNYVRNLGEKLISSCAFKDFSDQVYLGGFYVEFLSNSLFSNPIASVAGFVLPWMKSERRIFISSLLCADGKRNSSLYDELESGALTTIRERNNTLPAFGVVSELSLNDVPGIDASIFSNFERQPVTVTLKEVVAEGELYLISQVRRAAGDTYLAINPVDEEVMASDNILISFKESIATYRHNVADIVLTCYMYKTITDMLAISDFNKKLYEMPETDDIAPININDKANLGSIVETIEIVGFPRKLPTGHQASLEALKAAKKMGIHIEAGSTFVQPFTRRVTSKVVLVREPKFIQLPSCTR